MESWSTEGQQTTTNKRKQMQQLWVCFLPTDTWWAVRWLTQQHQDSEHRWSVHLISSPAMTCWIYQTHVLLTESCRRQHPAAHTNTPPVWDQQGCINGPDFNSNAPTDKQLFGAPGVNLPESQENKDGKLFNELNFCFGLADVSVGMKMVWQIWSLLKKEKWYWQRETAHL